MSRLLALSQVSVTQGMHVARIDIDFFDGAAFNSKKKECLDHYKQQCKAENNEYLTLQWQKDIEKCVKESRSIRRDLFGRKAKKTTTGSVN